VHTPNDGDTVFAVATGAISVRGDHGAIGALAAAAMSEAIVRAVMNARGIPDFPSYQDIKDR
jgi:L-aminopeptidase/D-esterase-like protein